LLYLTYIIDVIVCCQMMVLAVLLQFVWIVVTIVLSVPVLYLLLIDQMIDSGAAYVNLKHYGQSTNVE